MRECSFDTRNRGSTRPHYLSMEASELGGFYDAVVSTEFLKENLSDQWERVCRADG
jgi:hypothetical protein